MDQDLATLKTGSQNLTEERHQKSQVLYQVGMQKLLDIHQDEFSQPSALAESSQLFIQAIQLNNQDPRPFISLAYTHILLQQYKEARSYLNQSLKLTPHNSNALQLLAFIDEQTKRQEKNREKPSIPSTSNPETAVLDLALQTLTKLDLFTPLTTPAQQTGLENIAREIEGYIREIQANQHLILKNISETVYQQRLQTLEQSLDQIDHLLEASSQFQLLMAELKALLAQVQDFKQVGSSAPFAKESLKAWEQQSERFADQLDYWETRGYHITDLEQVYNQLIACLEEIQDDLAWV